MTAQVSRGRWALRLLTYQLDVLRRKLHVKLRMGNGLKWCSFPRTFVPLAVLNSLLFPLGFIPTTLQPLIQRAKNRLALCGRMHLTA